MLVPEPMLKYSFLQKLLDEQEVQLGLQFGDLWEFSACSDLTLLVGHEGEFPDTARPLTCKQKSDKLSLLKVYALPIVGT